MRSKIYCLLSFVMLLLAACYSETMLLIPEASEPKAVPSDLANTRWQLVSLQLDNDHHTFEHWPTESAPGRITFYDDGTFSAHNGCNSMEGNYMTGPQRPLQLRTTIETVEQCLSIQLELEDGELGELFEVPMHETEWISDALNDAHDYEINHNELRIYFQNKRGLITFPEDSEQSMLLRPLEMVPKRMQLGPLPAGQQCLPRAYTSQETPADGC